MKTRKLQQNANSSADQWLNVNEILGDEWIFYTAEDIGAGDCLKYYPKGEGFEKWTRELTISRFKGIEWKQVKSSQSQMKEAISLRYPDANFKNLSDQSLDKKSLVFLIENLQYPMREDRVTQLLIYRQGTKYVYAIQITYSKLEFAYDKIKKWVETVESMKIDNSFHSSFNVRFTSAFNYFSEYNVDLILINKSAGLDEFPIWLSKGKKIAFCEMGKYYSVDLEAVHAVKGKWGNRELAVVDIFKKSALEKETFESIAQEANHNPRECIEENIGKIQINIDVMSTEMKLIRNDGDEAVILKSGGEVYHSPTVSPDGKYIAFIAEASGLMLMNLEGIDSVERKLLSQDSNN